MFRNFFRLLRYFAIFLLLGVIASFLIYKLVNLNKTVEVPSLRGKSVSEARKLLYGRKLSLKIEGEDYDAKVPKDYIVRQDVEPGKKIKIGTHIKVFVSKGSEIFSMPSFEGQLLRDAKLTLINLGIKIWKVTRVHSDTVGKGRIIAQRPIYGNVRSNKVNFLVSLGPYRVLYKCPSFINMAVDDARQLAKALGLKLIEQDGGNIVIFQKPGAGAIVKRGDSIEITLGQGWGLWF